MPHKNRPESSFKDDESISQELSALVDGEFDGDIDNLLSKASGDHGCRAAWQRYHLVRDVMQRDYHPALESDFAAKLSLQIAREEGFSGAADTSNVVSLMDKKASAAPLHQSGKSTRRWLPVAGLGLAASVAAAGFMAWQLTGPQNTNSGAPIEVAQNLGDNEVGQNLGGNAGDIELALVAPDSNSEVILLADAIVPAVYKQKLGTHWLASTAEPRNKQVESRLNSLLLNHLEDSTMGRVQGMLAHSRVVAYDSVSDNESF